MTTRLAVFVVTVLCLLSASPLVAEGGRVSGEVVDENGKPVSALRLRLVTEAGERALGSIEVNKGRFVIPAFPRGAHRLEIEGGDVAIRRFEIDIRGSDGARLGGTEADVAAHATAPTFVVSAGQRAELKLVVGAQADPIESGSSSAAIAQARASSAALATLNEIFVAGDMAALLVATEQILAGDPDLGGAVYMHAIALWKTGRAAEAVPLIRRAAGLVPDQPGIQGVLGSILLAAAEERQGPAEEREAIALAAEAADAFAKQLAATPADKNALTNRVIALERAGKSEEAVAALETLVAADPGDVRAYHRIAEMLIAAGQAEQALVWLERAPSKDAHTAALMHNAAIELYNRGEAQLAADAMRAAIAIAPELPHLHRLLGHALLALGKLAEARAELEEFLRLAPDDPEAAATRALIQELERQQPEG